MPRIQPKILVIGTGGVITSKETKSGLKPAHTPEQLLSFFPELEEVAQIDAIKLFELDSSNIGPKEWQRMIRCVSEKYHDYEGFVIMHGKDTMTYSAAALTFALQNLEKSVIFTGAHKPIDDPENDIRDQLIDALYAASSPITHGVHICIDKKIISGVHARKISNELGGEEYSLGTYVSVGAPEVGTIENDSVIENPEYSKWRIFPQPSPMKEYASFSSDVGFIKAYPGMPEDTWDCAKKRKAILVEALSVGHIPSSSPQTIQKIKEITQSGVPIFITSQNIFGTVNMNLYEVGRKILKAGAIPVPNMTTITALVKLMWTLGNFKQEKSEIEKIMLHNFFGEITT